MDQRTPELVEALFLEARKPIVVFDASDADLLTTRLLTAFWPTIRSEFSVCTYALGPRKIGGRDFDLVFAPKNARSRFSNWSGRKIEAGSPKSARHRWSSAVAVSILQSPHPTLSPQGMRSDFWELTAQVTRLRSESRCCGMNWQRRRLPALALSLVCLILSTPSLVSHSLR